MTGCPRAGGSHVPGAGAGLAGAASRGGRRAGSSTEANNGEPPRIMTAWVGRLELHCALVRRPRSGSYRRVELRFLRSLGDRLCPWLSVASPAVADPARTKGSVHPVAVLTCSWDWRRPGPAGAWSLGGAGGHRTDPADKGPRRDGEPSVLWVAASPR